MSQISQTLRLPIKITRIHIPWPVLGTIIVVGGLLVTLIFSLLAYQIYFLDRVHLGVQVDGANAETLTRFELQQLVIRKAEGLLNRQIMLVSDEGNWTMTAAELGARIDIEETINRTFSVGRQGSFFSDLLIQIQAVQKPVNIQPVIKFDSGPANKALDDIALALNRLPSDAQLLINDQLRVTVIPAEVGQTINIETTREAIRNAIVSRGQATIDLEIDYVSPDITVVEPTRQHVETFLSRPLIVTYGEQSWSLEPKFLADLIVFETSIDNGVGRITAHLKQEPLVTYFRNLALEIDQRPINAWFDLNQTTWTLYPIIESQNGLTLDVETAVTMVAAQLEQPGFPQLSLPVIVEPPAISMDNVKELGIRELMSSSTSYFKGSSLGRMQNIATSASKFHGLVIPPGEIFSFNDHLGDVTAANGFVESLIIQGDRTAVGIGGGVCQVSTTVFRAAFYGGFEIVERWAHGYRVSWYETGSKPGLDATIYSPAVDFKFRNDTDSYILIQTNTDLKAGTITFSFYGTSSNRSVIVSDPVEANYVKHGPPIYEEDSTLKPGEVKQIDWAKDGVDVTVYRTVLEGDAILHQDTVFSRYRPWQAVYKVGPDKNR